jgi:uncharacterized protein DUF3892
MPDTVRITCVNKREHHNPHERITNVGGLHSDGTTWKMTEQTAIVGIEQQQWKLYVSVGGKRVWVVIATHFGRKYLKTEADGYAPNNLLSLPECP